MELLHKTLHPTGHSKNLLTEKKRWIAKAFIYLNTDFFNKNSKTIFVGLSVLLCLRIIQIRMNKMLHFLFAVLVIYLLVVLFFWLFQSRFLFYPQPLGAAPVLDKNVEEVRIETSRDQTLHGWLCKSQGADPQKLIIYFGGNAEEVSHMIGVSKMFDEWAMLLVNYPGYGQSQGKPGQKSFFNAALSIYDYAVSREDIDPQNIVLMGRSIGTGSAVYVAHERKVRAVVLISPFESLRSVAQSKMPFLPVGLILRHPFPSKKYASKIQAPLLAFYGTQDQIVPGPHSRKLVNAWEGPSTLVTLEGFNHNDIFESARLWQETKAFLQEL